MTPSLTYLKDVLKGRTAGPWWAEHGKRGFSVWAPCGETGSMQIAATNFASFDQENAEAIALMGTVADELLAVVEAAEEMVSGKVPVPNLDFYVSHFSICGVEAALSVLQSAIDKHRGGSA